MSNDQIKELIQIFIESGVGEMEVKRGENSLRLRKDFTHVPATEVVIPQAFPHPAVPSSAPSAPTSAGGPPQPQVENILVKSPIVGTFYECPKPGDPPFVKVGDAVESGQVLCIIESMKLMNEIESEVSGIVAARLVENGRPVEYGEALFAIRPR